VKNILLIAATASITYFATKKGEDVSLPIETNEVYDGVDSFQIRQDSLVSILKGSDKKVESVVAKTIGTITNLKEAVASLTEEVKVLKNENTSLKSVISSFSSDTASKFNLLPINKSNQ
jgi:hypothetical protein